MSVDLVTVSTENIDCSINSEIVNVNVDAGVLPFFVESINYDIPTRTEINVSITLDSVTNELTSEITLDLGTANINVKAE